MQLPRARTSVVRVVSLALVACAGLAGCGHEGRSSKAARTSAAFAAGTCPLGGELRGPACACRADLRLVLGACVPPRVAAEACGVSGRATADGCVALEPCEPGHARDLDTGACLSRRDVRALASSVGLLVADDEILRCPQDGELAVAAVGDGAEAPRLGCVPRSACRRGSRSVPPAGTCLPERACPPGTILETTGACARVVRSASRSRETRIDVAAWLRAVVGADGGPGAPPLCEALARGPGALGVLSPTSTSIAVVLAFPDNDVTQVVADVSAPGDTQATVELDQLTRPLIEALRSLGGTAEQGSVGVTVQCRRAAAERPAVALEAAER